MIAAVKGAQLSQASCFRGCFRPFDFWMVSFSVDVQFGGFYMFL